MNSKDTSSDESNPPVNRLDTTNHEEKPPGNGEGTSSNGEKPSVNIMNTSSVSEEDSNPQTRKGNMEQMRLRINVSCSLHALQVHNQFLGSQV